MSPTPDDTHHHHHHHPHSPAGVNRRALLQGMAAGVGLAIVSSLAQARPALAATSKATLPGFDAFQASVRTLRSGRYYLVESNGLPLHNMMVGITNWQQQVPVPQPYTGTNAWRIPVTPKLATQPISGKSDLFRGAIALAVDGVPIFNALNNRGEDSYAIGELDTWGGHCGRADDYHYHAAPLHLSQKVGATKPIAYALDGFPIYGALEPNGTAMQPLDEYNGHMFKGSYHYHGTTTYPYINGGMRGVVTVKDGQVDPQPTTRPFRPDGAPLPGAVITEFSRSGDTTFALAYTYKGGTNHIDYTTNGTTVDMTFTDATGKQTHQTYSRR